MGFLGRVIGLLSPHRIVRGRQRRAPLQTGKFRRKQKKIEIADQQCDQRVSIKIRKKKVKNQQITK